MGSDPDQRPVERTELDVYQLALTEARAGFEALMAQPELIRKNVGSMLGFAAIAASLFGISGSRPATVTGVVYVAGWVALGSFTVLGVCAVIVMLPLKVEPGMQAKEIVGWGDAGDDEGQTTRNLALHLDSLYQTNKVRIDGRFKVQIVAAGALGLAVLALAAQLLGG